MRLQLKGRLFGRLLRSLLLPQLQAHHCSSTLPHHQPPTLSRLTPHPLTLCRSFSQTPRTQNSILCWKCSRELRREHSQVQFFCPCERQVVLPPSNSHTYFEIMSCPNSYRVDIESLKKTFKELQRQLHPDKFSRKSQEEQDYSVQQSALVNTAYSTLLNPHKRGLYLLELNGLTINETDNLMEAPEFLEDMWSLRERIDDATASGETTALRQLQTTNSANLESVSEKVGAAFDAGDYVGAKEKLARMKYFVNIDMLLKDTLDLPS